MGHPSEADIQRFGDVEARIIDCHVNGWACFLARRCQSPSSIVCPLSIFALQVRIRTSGEIAPCLVDQANLSVTVDNPKRDEVQQTPSSRNQRDHESPVELHVLAFSS